MNSLGQLPVVSLRKYFGNEFPIFKKPSDSFQEHNGFFSILQQEMILEIFECLTLHELRVSKLVCKRWSILENNLSSALFFLIAIEGHHNCSLLHRDYHDLLKLSNIFDGAFSKLKEPDYQIFVKALFRMGAPLTFKNKATATLQMIDAFDLPAEQGCAKSQFALSCCYQRDHDKESFKYCEQSANQGFLPAENLLSAMYEYGFGTKKNLQKSFAYCQRAANQGCPTSLMKLSRFYDAGIGTEKNVDKAILCLSQGIKELGEDSVLNDDLFLLAYLYEKVSKINPENQEKMIYYYKAAAKRGNLAAQIQLGLAFINGNGDEFQRDYKTAAHYYELAAKQNDLGSIFKICRFYACGVGVGRNCHQASNYFQQLENFDFGGRGPSLGKLVQAFYYLGYCYYKGIGVDQNIEEALRYFELEQPKEKHPWSFYYLGEIYELHRQETIKVHHYYQLAAEQNIGIALFKMCQYHQDQNSFEESENYFKLLTDPKKIKDDPAIQERYALIGKCYELGLGISKDLKEAKRYKTLAADLGHAASQFDFCKEYAANKDHKMASDYFKLLSDPNHPDGTNDVEQRYRMIGSCYLEGIGVEQNKKEALHYLTLATELGDSEAMNLLKIFDAATT